MTITALPEILACSVCMGTGKDHLDSVAAGYAMLVMLLLIIPLLCSIILFIVRIAKRERENFDTSLSDL